MKLCRFEPLAEPGRSRVSVPNEPESGAARYGIVEGRQVFAVEGIFRGAEKTGKAWDLEGVKLLAPAAPSKIICVGRNYAQHAAELGNDLPEEPLIFLKPPSAILAPGDPIVLPPLSRRVDFEGELAVVMGKTCARLREGDEVRPYVLGYTCLNDVTARDLQKKDVQFTRAKGFDTFCPFGPFLETAVDLPSLVLETSVNGHIRQSARVSEMIFSVDVIIRWISQVMTLRAGDVISTGTPSGVGPLRAGDTVEVSISGIGTLKNPVSAL